jgi:hypothetical protein
MEKRNNKLTTTQKLLFLAFKNFACVRSIEVAFWYETKEKSGIGRKMPNGGGVEEGSSFTLSIARITPTGR